MDRFHDGTEEDAGDKDELMILYSGLNSLMLFNTVKYLTAANTLL